MLHGFSIAAFLIAAAASQAQPITAPAGPPELIETGPTATDVAQSEAEYQRFADTVWKTDPGFVAITKKPAGLTSAARFGINLILGDKNLSWILDGDDQTGYILYPDLNGNGDLTDDPPLRFERLDGHYTLRIERQERDGDVTYPISTKLVVDRVVPPGKSEPQLALLRYQRTTRRGELHLPGVAKPIAFRLTGSAGMYSHDYHIVALDLNGDGTFDTDTEVYRVSEKYVNVGDAGYEFVVDRFGRSLTLVPLAEHRLPRANISRGAATPEFSFVDMNGKQGSFAEYKGKVVLLDFWGVWCAPCVVEAPRLAALYEKFHDRGFEIIGIDASDTRDKVAAFAQAHKMTWRQIIEADKGPLQTLFRVNGFPTYFLIARDGRIVTQRNGSADVDWDSAIDTLLAFVRRSDK
jgi:thiol-disulfide isomerase/thioredoxin